MQRSIIVTWYLLAFGVPTGDALIINLNARVHSAANPVQRFLEAGTYRVQPIGTEDGGDFDAWNAWGRTTCADPQGCTKPQLGWLHLYTILSADFTAINIGGHPVPVTPDTTEYTVWDERNYPAAIIALAKAQSSVFTLRTSGLVGFAIPDLPHALFDNQGGMSLEVVPTAAILPESLAVVKFGILFSQTLVAVLPMPPFTWTISNGTLPSGVTLSSEGILSGTPTEAGEFPFTVRATDSNGNSTEKAFTLQVLVTLPPPDIRVHKTGTVAVPGRTLDYFIIVENVGNINLENGFGLELLFPPSYFTFVSADPLPDSVQKSFVFWNIPLLKPGGAKILQYSVSLNPSVELAATVVGPFGIDFAKDKAKERLEETLKKWGEMSCVDKGALEKAKFWCPKVIDRCTPIPIDVVECGLVDNECASQLDDATKDCKLPDPSLPAPESAMCQLVVPEYVAACNKSVRPRDPNEKLVVAKRFIQPDQLLVYPIHFENKGDVEALDVFVTDVLDPNLRASTLEILTPGGSFDAATRTLRWELRGINLQPGATGTVLYTIRPRRNLPSGTRIRNKATIQFEIFELITTNQVVNIIDSTPPSCTVDPLPEQMTTRDIPLSWSGTDIIGKIDSYTIFVSEDEKVFTPFLERTRDTKATFRGKAGKTYAFICVATDTAGNVEVQPPEAEAETQISGPPLLCHGLEATILGTGQDDVLEGTPGDDVIIGLGGNDTIHGRGGQDTICGGQGNDTISGGPGNDWLDSGPGDDRLAGGPGNDMLRGRPGDDLLNGGEDRDTCHGGTGHDTYAHCERVPLRRMPLCGDQDGSERPLVFQCPEFVSTGNVQTLAVPGTGPVTLTVDFVFRGGSFKNTLDQRGHLSRNLRLLINLFITMAYMDTSERASLTSVHLAAPSEAIMIKKRS